MPSPTDLTARLPGMVQKPVANRTSLRALRGNGQNGLVVLSGFGEILQLLGVEIS